MKTNYRLFNPNAKALLFFGLLCLLPPAIAEPAIQPFAANYRAYYFGIAINATRELKKTGNNTMALRFHVESPFMDINETATLTWRPQQSSLLIPLEYQFHRTGIGKDLHTQLIFDWQAKQVIDTQANTRTPMPENTVVLDRLGYQLQLQYDLINGRTEFDYLIVDGDKLKNFRFRVIGEEMLMTELGELETVKVGFVRDNDKRATHIWFAKNWDYLLAQLEQREKDGKKYRIKLLNATVNGLNVVGK